MSWQRQLGYEPSNTVDTLRKKYKRLALRQHPDKGGTNANFQRLLAAWENAQRALSVRAAATVASRPRQQQPPAGFTSIFRQPSTSSNPRRRTGLYGGRTRQPNVQYYSEATPMNWEPTPMNWQAPRRSSAARRPRGVGKRRAAPRRPSLYMDPQQPRRRR